MGNRAVITASRSKTDGIGIYLHWAGDINSVVALLDAAKQLGFRCPTVDNSYGMARLCSIACLISGVRSDTSVGINTLPNLDCDNWDNGVYVVGPNWSLIDRWGKGSVPLTPENIEAARKSKTYQQVMGILTRELDSIVE